jgi:hypothetical protein
MNNKILVSTVDVAEVAPTAPPQQQTGSNKKVKLSSEDAIALARAKDQQYKAGRLSLGTTSPLATSLPATVQSPAPAPAAAGGARRARSTTPSRAATGRSVSYTHPVEEEEDADDDEEEAAPAPTSQRKRTPTKSSRTRTKPTPAARSSPAVLVSPVRGLPGTSAAAIADARARDRQTKAQSLFASPVPGGSNGWSVADTTDTEPFTSSGGGFSSWSFFGGRTAAAPVETIENPKLHETIQRRRANSSEIGLEPLGGTEAHADDPTASWSVRAAKFVRRNSVVPIEGPSWSTVFDGKKWLIRALIIVAVVAAALGTDLLLPEVEIEWNRDGYVKIKGLRSTFWHDELLEISLTSFIVFMVKGFLVWVLFDVVHSILTRTVALPDAFNLTKSATTTSTEPEVHEELTGTMIMPWFHTFSILSRMGPSS